MRIRVDKNFTTVSCVGVTKDAIVEFKARYTDNDIREFIEDEFNVNLIGDIVLLDMDAWNSDLSMRYEKTTFFVNSLIIETFTGFIKVSNVGFNLELELINPQLAKITHYNPSDE